MLGEKVAIISFLIRESRYDYHPSWRPFKASTQPESLNGLKSRHLLLGRKVMTNLDSIFKSRDITLPTKVHLVKAMVFPLVMYGYESWTIKKLSAKELMLLNCGVGEDS